MRLEELQYPLDLLPREVGKDALDGHKHPAALPHLGCQLIHPARLHEVTAYRALLTPEERAPQRYDLGEVHRVVRRAEGLRPDPLLPCVEPAARIDQNEVSPLGMQLLGIAHQLRIYIARPLQAAVVAGATPRGELLPIVAHATIELLGTAIPEDGPPIGSINGPHRQRDDEGLLDGTQPLDLDLVHSSIYRWRSLDGAQVQS